MPSRADKNEMELIFEEKGLLGRLKRRWLSLRWWHKLLALLACVLLLGATVALVLLIVVLARAGAASTPASSLDVLNSATTPGVDDNRQMQRARTLADALKIKTISFGIGEQNFTAFPELHEFLRSKFPLVHGSPFIQREVVNAYSLLYTVTGSDNGNKLPYLLASHMDVVPANPQSWEVDPFGGVIVNDTYIYGRGTMDNKGGVLGTLEALEYMLGQGERPRRSFYLAFGHDEEILGSNGAQEIAKSLKSRGVNKLDFVLDEGLFVTQDIFPGVTKPVALIGVSEKGALSLELSVTGTPGHSSFPPWETSIGILAGAVYRLENNKLPSMLGQGVERYTFEYLAPHVDFGYRMLYSNMWLFSSLLTSNFERNQHMNTLIRTTTAMTVINGGIKGNVVPAKATAIVNHRIHPSQRSEDVLEFDSRVINDPRVLITVKDERQPHPVSPFGPGDIHYQLIAKSVSQTFTDAVVVPSVLVANTDTVWYLDFSVNVFRFFPTVQEPSDVARFHGNNERISVEHYGQSVSFYYRLFKNADLVIEFATPKAQDSQS